MKKSLFVIFIYSLIFFNSLYAKQYIDFSYFNSQDLNKYSLSYFRDISTYTLMGVGYSYYKEDIDNTHLIKLPLSFMHKNLFFTVKPFYYFDDFSSKAYGIKTGGGFVKTKEDVSTLYSVYVTFDRQNYTDKKYKDIILSAIVEKNYYDEFFIGFKAGLNLKYDKNKNGSFDYLEAFDYNYYGYINLTVYSNIGLWVVRSFKPEFNSDLIIGFDKINGVNTINSYDITLKMILDEENRYHMNIGYNFADFKEEKNKHLWKLSIGVVF